jgi:hypothetical protein
VNCRQNILLCCQIDCRTWLSMMSRADATNIIAN